MKHKKHKLSYIDKVLQKKQLPKKSELFADLKNVKRKAPEHRNEDGE